MLQPYVWLFQEQEKSIREALLKKHSYGTK